MTAARAGREEEVLEAVAELRAQPLLEGHRGKAPVNVRAVADLMERLGALLVANPTIEEVDINPVIASEGRLTVVDALIRCG